MFATVSVTLSTTTLAALLERQQRMGGDLSSTIEDAVEDWLSHHAREAVGARWTSSDPSTADSLDADCLDADSSEADSLEAEFSSADRFKAGSGHANSGHANPAQASSVPPNPAQAGSVPPNPAQAESRATGSSADVTREYCGYQWKSLFLPEGTLLRSWSYGEHRIARVVGNRILHEGRSVSPNQFARSFARSVRNAWKDLSLCLPGEKTFYRAFRLRDGIRPAPLPTTSPPAAQQAARRVQPNMPAPLPRGQGGSAAPAVTRDRTGTAARKAAAKAGKSAEKSAARQACLQAALEAAIAAQRAAQDPAARQVSPGARWDLPERRSMRHRLEDVAFE